MCGSALLSGCFIGLPHIGLGHLNRLNDMDGTTLAVKSADELAGCDDRHW